MSDDVSIYGENDRDFHSPFDLSFDPAAVETVKWLVMGHLFYLAGLAFAVLADISMGNVWVTPLFALPLLWAGRGRRDLAKIAVFVLLFTAAHYAATWAAVQIIAGVNVFGTDPPAGVMFTGGAVAGAVGAGLAFSACAVFRLFREGGATLVFAAFGTVLLAGIGSFGIYMYLTTDADGLAGDFGRLLWLYVPWQLTFAYVLSKTLKPVGA